MIRRSLNGHTKIIALFGNPIAHTASPPMQNAALEKLGLNYVYIPFCVSKSNISTAMESIRVLDFLGANVTVPFKESVIPYLDELTVQARLIGAVNTIKNDNGKLIGHNTDGDGFIEALKDLSKKFTPRKKKVVILGAGGGARAVAVALAQKKIKSLVLADVQEEKAKSLAAMLRSKLGVDVKGLTPNTQQFYNLVEEADLLINATPIGMHPKVTECPLSNISVIHPRQLVVDMVYNPAQTKFLKLAKHLGAKTQNGLGMLLYQGVLAFEIFTGHKAPTEVMRKALLEAVL
jgi:shikimate dehydrogenase